MLMPTVKKVKVPQKKREEMFVFSAVFLFVIKPLFKIDYLRKLILRVSGFSLEKSRDKKIKKK